MTHKILPVPFKPHPLVAGGHLQTIVGYYLPAPMSLGRAKCHKIDVSDGDQLILCENRASRKSAFPAVILLMHGLGGEASSPYMTRIAQCFHDRGWIAFRMNHRGAGEGRGLAKTTYHSGRSEDISQVLLKIEEIYPDLPVIAVGFSLSGNALLKLLGENRHPIPSNVRGAISVSPPIELSRCATAISRPENRMYDLRFIRLLREALRERQAAFSDFPSYRIPWYATVRQFDEIVTAPLNNFESADDYYAKCSAKQFLTGITLPTFLLASANDPFIPKASFDNLPKNDFLTVNITGSGGHMGFIAAEKTPLGSHRWMDYAILTYAETLIKTNRKTEPSTAIPN
ncbi:MAG: YheT family hydrolase [bacterium]